MYIFAKDLKVGDNVNCHEQGWLVVKEVEDRRAIFVTFTNGFSTSYSKGSKLFVIRA